MYLRLLYLLFNSLGTHAQIQQDHTSPLAESHLPWSLLCSRTCNTSSGHIRIDFWHPAYWAQQSPLCMSPSFNLFYFTQCSWFRLSPSFHVIKNQHKSFAKMDSGDPLRSNLKSSILDKKNWSAHGVPWRMFIFPFSAEVKPNGIYLGVTVPWLVNFCILFMAL